MDLLTTKPYMGSKRTDYRERITASVIWWQYKEKREIIMPQITCTDCGQQISSTAKTCPHCGRVVDPIIEGNRRKAYRASGKLMEKIGIAFLVVGFVVAILAANQYKIVSGEGYRLKEAFNWVLAVMVFVSSAFPAAVCYGIGKLIGAKADL